MHANLRARDAGRVDEKCKSCGDLHKPKRGRTGDGTRRVRDPMRGDTNDSFAHLFAAGQRVTPETSDYARSEMAGRETNLWQRYG